MRQAEILFKDQEAGILSQQDNGSFTFRYHDTWITDGSKPDISLTLPKSRQEHRSEFLFPFFYNMLPEGANKEMICRHNPIDQNDSFGLLMTTAGTDSIGAVRVVKIENQ